MMTSEDWGTVDYGEALARQRQIFEGVIAGENEGVVVFCEHPHTYTLGKNGRMENLLVDEDALLEQGAQLYRTDRGGDITYHGPGQLVCYPILDLGRTGLGLREYVEALERSVIETLAEFGIEASRKTGATGVWAENRKICAIGVRASRGVVMHGLALNVTTDLGRFGAINPCGLRGAMTTSITAERQGEWPLRTAEVKKILMEKINKSIGYDRKKMDSPPRGRSGGGGGAIRAVGIVAGAGGSAGTKGD